MKKFLYLLFFIILSVILMGCKQNNKEKVILTNIQENDLFLELITDKENNQLGDEITFKIILKNVSGKDLKLTVDRYEFKTIEDCIKLCVSINDESPSYFMHDYGGQKKEFIFEKDNVIIKEGKVKLLKNIKYTICAGLYFYDENEKFMIFSNKIIINIGENYD